MLSGFLVLAASRRRVERKLVLFVFLGSFVFKIEGSHGSGDLTPLHHQHASHTRVSEERKHVSLCL